ncbi:MAG TPA: hypothetical protein VM367_05875 [Pseudonocardia sp.]|jgi:hypothetical protein|nr:hypothetical protein [Pseudonocardia sp.]
MPGPAQPAAPRPLPRALDVLGRLGGLVTLAALLVVGAAVGGLADGQPAAGSVPAAILDGR